MSNSVIRVSEYTQIYVYRVNVGMGIKNTVYINMYISWKNIIYSAPNCQYSSFPGLFPYTSHRHICSEFDLQMKEFRGWHHCITKLRGWHNCITKLRGWHQCWTKFRGWLQCWTKFRGWLQCWTKFKGWLQCRTQSLEADFNAE